ncbi:unnamed protein product [Durusdinium trenchii]|uniref:Uncharacterized protein n=2 Tax=Durusdinium trenchii TaxID=1381693 RepID=A0ABP0K1J6_9DINO
MASNRFRQAAWRLARGGSLVVGLGLAAKELHDIFFEDAQVDARAQLFLGLAPHEIAERTEREKRLRNIMASAEGRAQEILAQHGGNASAQKAILNLRHQLVEEAHNVMYPSISREELQQRRQTFGNVKWTEDAMQRLCSFSPLVEVGAGEGQWQAELRRRGADVIAFDNHSSPSRFGDEASSRIMVPGAEVQRADAEAAMSGSVGRTLLLVYPPPGDMASRCLSAYGGETLIYVGEGRGGVNANNHFFDLLSHEWTLEESLSLETLPWSYESVYVLKRAHSSKA